MDGSGGAVGHRDYSPFGETTAYSGTVAFTHWWSTKPYESDTKIVRYELRDYLVELGRFVSKDPIGEWGGILLYAFLSNQALTQTDNLGLQSQIEGVEKPAQPEERKELVPCACDEKAVDQESAVAALRTRLAMIRDIFPNGKPVHDPFHPPAYMEHCSIVCCDKGKMLPYTVGPKKGHYRYEVGKHCRYLLLLTSW